MSRIDRETVIDLHHRIATELASNSDKINTYGARAAAAPGSLPEYGRYVTRLQAEDSVLEPVLHLLRSYLDGHSDTVPVRVILVEAIDAAVVQFSATTNPLEAAEGRSNGLRIIRDLIMSAGL